MPSNVSGFLPDRYADRGPISGFLPDRYSDVSTTGFLTDRYADIRQLGGFLTDRYMDISNAVGSLMGPQSPIPQNTFGFPPSSPPSGITGSFVPSAYYPFGVRVYAAQASSGVNFLLNDSAQGYLESLTYSNKKNEGVQFEMKLIFPIQLNTQSQLQNFDFYISDQAFTGSMTPDITINVEIQIADQTIQLSPFVVLKKIYEVNSDGWTFTISGSDYITRLLNNRNQNLNSFASSASQIVFSKTILSTFLPQFGITNMILNYDDFPIRTFHIQNMRPMDVLNQILWVPRAFWFSDGKTLMVQPWQLTTTPNWVFQDAQNYVLSLKEETQVSDLINRVKVSIAIPNGVKGADMESFSWGRFTANFSGSILRPYVQFESAFNGSVQSIDYFDINGNWVGHYPQESVVKIPASVGNGFIAGSGYANSVALVWAPPLGSQSPTPSGIQNIAPVTDTHFKCTFRGVDPLGPIFAQYQPPLIAGPYVMPSSITNYNAVYQNGVFVTQTPNTTTGISIDQQYSIIVQDSVSIAKYGVLEAEHQVENALIPNLPWAWRVGINTLQESGRLKQAYELEIPINPLIKVGHTIQIVDASKFINITGLVEQVSHEVNANEGITKLTAMVYQQ